ncbi:MAG: protein kinase [Lachnospiraceae bacterium]|nr:protein kinase [Lachnospiraceae bacterium]
MLTFEKTTAESILCRLDKMGKLFPEFEMHKVDEKPQLLGRGGFSSVYAMVQKSNHSKHYVIKVIGLERHVMTSEQFWDTTRYQKILAEKCKYVCRILDAKELVVNLDINGQILETTENITEESESEGVHLQLILMELVDEIIVKDKYKNASIINDNLKSEEGVIQFALQIGQALQMAHQNNILHRDIKLENIFYDKYDKCFKLGDFGIAKYSEGGSAETVVYTDGYGAPEIERRLSKNYNVTADIYSFGITLYLLLNDLCFPFSNGYYSEKVQYSDELAFPAPKKASVGMNRIIRKMCAYNPEDRYQSMTEVIMDLVALMQADNNSSDIELEYFDIETETYRDSTKESKNNTWRNLADDISGDLVSNRCDLYEDTSYKDASHKNDSGLENMTRYQRILEEKKISREYNESCILLGIIIPILMYFFIGSIHSESVIVNDWRFFILPIMFLIEIIFIKIRDFHIFFGFIVVGLSVYSIHYVGLTLPHILMLGCLLTGSQLLIFSSSIATTCWILAVILKKNYVLAFFDKYDLSWIFAIILLEVIFEYLLLRIYYGIATELEACVSILMMYGIYLAIFVCGILLSIVKGLGFAIPKAINVFHLIVMGIIGEGIYCLKSNRLSIYASYIQDVYEDYEDDDEINLD